MIGPAGSRSLLRALVPRLPREAPRRSLSFRGYESARAVYGAGYVVTPDRDGLALQKPTRADSFLGIPSNSPRRHFSTEEDLKSMSFEKISNETLESLSEYFDELIEEASHLQDADVSSGDGVLTVKFGKKYGTYVLNRQVPNQQIWLSSPKSGPKRYDFIDGTWIYKHDGKSLYELLNEEISDVVKFPVSFNKCSYGIRRK